MSFVPDPGEASLAVALGLFAAAAVAILLVGTRLTDVADTLAKRTGLGEAMVGPSSSGRPPCCRGSSPPSPRPPTDERNWP